MRRLPWAINMSTNEMCIRDRNKHDGDQRQPQVHAHHEPQGTDQRDRAGKELNHGMIHHFSDGVHIVHEPAHELAVAVGVVVAHGKIL